jgi:hypothetical protein
LCNAGHGNGESNVTIANVSIVKYSHDDFVRIGEYFNGGVECKGRRCIVRDDERSRAGVYFIVGFSKPLNRLPKDLTIVIHAMVGCSLEPERFEFNLPNTRKSFTAEVYCGITSGRVNVGRMNAWKVELIDRDGNILANYGSHMWPKNM